MPIRLPGLCLVVLYLMAEATSAQQTPDPTDPFPIVGGPVIYPGALFGPSGVDELRKIRGEQMAMLEGRPTGQEAVEHDPLINIKVRVIEVQRDHALAVSSVLEYVSQEKYNSTLTSGQPLNVDENGPFQNLSGVTNFLNPGLISFADGTISGNGMIVNTTSQHINHVARLLAGELNGDVITAPQVTTKNGATVTFRAGANLPFEVGSNIIQQNATNVTQFVYSHVGTYIEVTPDIVNWGPGLGRRPIVADDILFDPKGPIRDWGTLIFWMVKRGAIDNPSLQSESIPAPPPLPDDLFMEPPPGNRASSAPGGVGQQDERPVPLVDFDSEVEDEDSGPVKILAPGPTDSDLCKYLGQSVVPTTIKKAIVDRLNEYSRADLVERGLQLASGGPAEGCSWHPEDCTIDLAINVNLSQPGAPRPGTTSVGSKQNVRAIDNRVQVASGHGVIIGGLITAQDAEAIEKVPVLGDVPVVGFLFRSKATNRTKTETLIFVEASVLPDNSVFAKEATGHDFSHGRVHLADELNNSPLLEGLDRAGLDGGYLPLPTHAERAYWMEYQASVRERRHRKVATEIRDTLK